MRLLNDFKSLFDNVDDTNSDLGHERTSIMKPLGVYMSYSSTS